MAAYTDNPFIPDADGRWSRRGVFVLACAMLIAGLSATPADARVHRLDGPQPTLWISDPDGPGGIDQLDPVDGARGAASVKSTQATIRLRTTGLEHRHAYTMWVVYFNDQTACVDGCGGDDLARPGVGGGVLYGDGKVVGATGTATFAAHLSTGDGTDVLGPPPPPFALAPYEAGPDNEFHVVIRSHGPADPQALNDQILSFEGGCQVEVGPAPGEVGDFPVPSSIGECGDVQVHIFS